jgi:hypothetical protein
MIRRDAEYFQGLPAFGSVTSVEKTATEKAFRGTRLPSRVKPCHLEFDQCTDSIDIQRKIFEQRYGIFLCCYFVAF